MQNDTPLFGSSVLPSHLMIKGKLHQLGDIVRHAFIRSGLSAEEWNKLPPLEREKLLVESIYQMNGWTDDNEVWVD